MSTQTGITLKTYFNTGDKPTEAQFADLIDSKLNLTDGGNITGNVTSSNYLTVQKTGFGTSLSVASGSAEAFDAIAPPFVAGLQPHIKTFLLNPHTVMHEAVFGNTNGNTNMWETDTDNSSAVVSIGTATDFIHGGFTLTTGGSDGHQTSLSTAAKPFKCAAGKPWWAKIQKDEKLRQKAFDTAQTYDADGSIVSYGIYWDGIDSVRYFANKVASGTVSGPLALIHTYNTTAGIPDDSDMFLGFYLATGLGSTKTATIEFLEGAIAV